MEISDNLLCLYSAKVERHRDRYVIEVPKNELQKGDIDQDHVYRVALLLTNSPQNQDDTTTDTPQTEQSRSGPPVEEGDTRKVEIEDIGDQGDGIGKIERGYVVIVPESKRGDEVTVEIEMVKENFAIGQIVRREI